MSLVTLFTDASHNRNLNRAVWAAWAKQEGKTIRFSGTLKAPIKFISEAELSAIANGLFIIKKSFAPEHNSKIICQTDSYEALQALRSREHPRASAKHIVNYIWSFSSQNNFILDLRHVKGHKGNVTPRNAVNSWCDSECRRLMGELLQKETPELNFNKREQTYA